MNNGLWVRLKRLLLDRSGWGAFFEELRKQASKGNIEQVKALLEQGADVNGKNKKGVTPIIDAAGNGKTEMIQSG